MSALAGNLSNNSQELISNKLNSKTVWLKIKD